MIGANRGGIGVRRWKPKGADNAPQQQDLGFKKLDADLTLAHQLFRAGLRVIVFAGVMGVTQRREVIRGEILKHDFAERPLVDEHGKPTDENFATAFERLYGEPLQPQGD